MNNVAPQHGMASHDEIAVEISEIAAGWGRSGRGEDRPRIDYPPYRGSILRHPKASLHAVNPEEIDREVGAPLLQTATCCGVPDGNAAFRVALNVVTDLEEWHTS
jgi:protocatechuate 3,4-dioxygenase beta subunit-like protein